MNSRDGIYVKPSPSAPRFGSGQAPGEGRACPASTRSVWCGVEGSLSKRKSYRDGTSALIPTPLPLPALPKALSVANGSVANGSAVEGRWERVPLSVTLLRKERDPAITFRNL